MVFGFVDAAVRSLMTPPTKEEYDHVPSNFSLRLKMRVYIVTYSLYGKAQRKLCRPKSHAGSNKACLCVVCVAVADTVCSPAVTHSYRETSAESAERLVQTP